MKFRRKSKTRMGMRPSEERSNYESIYSLHKFVTVVSTQSACVSTQFACGVDIVHLCVDTSSLSQKHVLKQ
ncbi:hypothetical protein Taro_008296 [Colocasia esculenta]|uniref:Uncharacterized protein n=1 Tax=Colocasia esculenta TaxID=4460 RepID=A0A843U1G3_COLES|nr:hypothetical protein [Colocasia esculenta]